jgi:uncharacterized protein YgbK (DUF1537 family)
LGPRALLAAEALQDEKCRAGGLVVAGSYVNRSSQQIGAAQALPSLASLEISVPRLLDPGTRQAEIGRVSNQVDQGLAGGLDVLVFTSRELVTGEDAGASLAISRSVSQSLVEVIHGIAERPAWIIAKGGITASDIATQGLGIRRARVLGQILPGVPVWRAGSGSRWPGLIYVVFPGNVGGPQDLSVAITRLKTSSNLSRADRYACSS